MENKGSGIVGPSGQPIEDQPSMEEIEKVKAEVEDMVKDPEVEQYGSALVGGYRLNAWGHHYISLLGKYSKEARQVYYNTVMMGLVDPAAGGPRPFSENSLVKHLAELLPKMVVEVNERTEAVRAAKEEAETKEPKESIPFPMKPDEPAKTEQDEEPKTEETDA